VVRKGMAFGVDGIMIKDYDKVGESSRKNKAFVNK
jgi:hypothetical protein